MFSNFLNNTFLHQENDKYEIVNTHNFFKRDFDELASKSESEIITELLSSGMLKRFTGCFECGRIVNKIFYPSDRHPYFRCSNRNCRRPKISLFKNTIFDGIKIKISEVLNILYYFSCRRTLADASETLNISKPTISSFYDLFRGSISYFLNRYSCKLGGQGIVVHFDETPITRRHGNTGTHQPSNTVWVVGAVDIHSRKCFLKFLPSHSREVLFSFFNEWILPGSVVHTDSHASYRTLSSLGFTHFRVNHSQNLVSDDGIHTNWIEGIFGCLKKLRRKYDSSWTNVENLERFLSEFCFRYSFECWDRRKAFISLCFMLRRVKEDMDIE